MPTIRSTARGRKRISDEIPAARSNDRNGNPPANSILLNPVKLRKRQRVLLALAILVLALGAAAFRHHYRSKRALADYQQQLVASGEKLTVEEMIPKPVPPEQNGADIFIKAMTFMNAPTGVLDSNLPDGMTMVAPGKARVAWAQPNIRSKEATNTWEEALAPVGKLAASLEALEELIERPALDRNINYGMGFAAPLPNLAQSKRVAQQLYYAMLCELHRGNAASATLRLRTLIALVQGSADERLVISQLVRIAITAIGFGGTWELLQSPAVTDEQLAQIQSDWSRLEFNLPAENALSMERAMEQMTVDQMRDSSAEFRKIASGYSWPGPGAASTGGNWLEQAEQFGKDNWNKTRLKAKETAWRFSWSYTDQLRTLKGDQVLIETARLARTNGNFGAALALQEQRLNALGIRSMEIEESFGRIPADMDFRTLLSQGVLSLTKFLDKVMKIEVSRQLTVTAIGLQRYKLKHRNYPRDLATLVPELLPAIPRDPVDGKPLRYKTNADGTFLLYSVGEDGDDNGGDASPVQAGSKSLYWQRCRDWVWPQPATPQEVEDFYQHEFK